VRHIREIILLKMTHCHYALLNVQPPQEPHNKMSDVAVVGTDGETARCEHRGFYNMTNINYQTLSGEK